MHWYQFTAEVVTFYYMDQEEHMHTITLTEYDCFLEAQEPHELDLACDTLFLQETDAKKSWKEVTRESLSPFELADVIQRHRERVKTSLTILMEIGADGEEFQ